MNINKNRLVILVFILPLFAFSQKARLKKGNEMYNQKAYYFAIQTYEDVLERGVDSMKIANNIADSYDKIANYKKAAEWYHFIKSNSRLSQDQLFRLAMIERILQRYSRSNKLLKNYQEKYGENDVVTNILNSSTTINDLRNSVQTAIVNQSINSPYSDMGLTFISDSTIIFTSARRDKMATKQVNTWTGGTFYHLYNAKLNDVKNIGSIHRTDKELQADYHEGPASFCPKNNYIYINRSKVIKDAATNEQKMIMKIFRAEYSDGEIKHSKQLVLGEKQFTYVHPAISQNGDKLFFASNRNGGNGGMDIFYVPIDENGMPTGEPINMGGKINTSANELFPFYSSDENKLFFSSDGLFGLGGLDIFKADLSEENKVLAVQNLKTPFNSSYDDFSFVLSSSGENGFLASNRKGGKGKDDIYSFTRKTPEAETPFKGIIRDRLTNDYIEGATIYLTSDGEIIDSTLTNDEGKFNLPLEASVSTISLTLSKENYKDTSLTISRNKKETYLFLLSPTFNYHIAGAVTNQKTGTPIDNALITVERSKIDLTITDYYSDSEGKFNIALPVQYKDTLNLMLKTELKGYGTNNISLHKIMNREQKIEVTVTLIPFVVQPIYFDFNSAKIQSESKTRLDELVSYLNENPEVKVKLNAYADRRGNDTYNLKLSQLRARKAADYLVKNGINSERLEAKGFGEKNLSISEEEINAATTKAEKEKLRAKNRRIEFEIVK